MEKESWHSSFNPQQFLSRVNLNELIKNNEVFNAKYIQKPTETCFLCNRSKDSGILLNDGTYLCSVCFSEVSTISYPQKYEELRRCYLAEKKSREIALEAFIKKYSYKRDETPLFKLAGFSLVLLFFHPGFIVISIVLFLISVIIVISKDEKTSMWNN